MTPPAWTWRVPFDRHPPCANLLDRIRRRVGMTLPSCIRLCSCLHSLEQPIRVCSCPSPHWGNLRCHFGMSPFRQQPNPLQNPPWPRTTHQASPRVNPRRMMRTLPHPGRGLTRIHSCPLVGIWNPPSRHDRTARGVGTSGQKYGPP